MTEAEITTLIWRGLVGAVGLLMSGVGVLGSLIFRHFGKKLDEHDDWIKAKTEQLARWEEKLQTIEGNGAEIKRLIKELPCNHPSFPLPCLPAGSGRQEKT